MTENDCRPKKNSQDTDHQELDLPQENYEPQWDKHADAKQAAMITYIGGVVAAVVLASSFPKVDWLFAILWGVASLVVTMRVNRFRCPRCGEFFYSKGFYYNTFARHCLHCGLEAGAKHG